MKQWQTLKNNFLKDPAVRQEYEQLAPQYELAAQLIEVRLKKGFTQAELAEKVGTRQSAIARLESGTYNPSIQFLEKVAKATNLRLVVILKP